MALTITMSVSGIASKFSGEEQLGSLPRPHGYSPGCSIHVASTSRVSYRLQTRRRFEVSGYQNVSLGSRSGLWRLGLTAARFAMSRHSAKPGNAIHALRPRFLFGSDLNCADRSAKDFKIRAVLARSKACWVCRAVHRPSGQSVALKIFHKNSLHVLQIHHMRREIYIHSRMSHPNILPLVSPCCAPISPLATTPRCHRREPLS